jgi:hypothetical protein
MFALINFLMIFVLISAVLLLGSIAMSPSVFPTVEGWIYRVQRWVQERRR